MTSFNRKNQKGAVSIFVVILFAMLATIIVVSFIRISVRDQSQATDNDLSRSAYDSALAGVEDAKRAISEYVSTCSSGSPRCAVLQNAFDNDCTALSDAGIVTRQTSGSTGNSETIVGGSNSLNQAYTCVNINMNTDDYIGTVQQDEVSMIPLKGVGSFSSVEISWSTKEDVGESGVVNLQSLGSTVSQLPMNNATDWPGQRPAMLRTQFIRHDTGSIQSSQFDEGRYSMVGFLHPSRTGVNSITDGNMRSRSSTSIAPQLVRCENVGPSRTYSCTLRINFSEAVATNDTMYLALSGIYADAHYGISLMNGPNRVQFDGVQPEIDATGRADALFRRVLVRVEAAADFPYPESAVDLTGNLCKNFRVTDAESGYSSICVSTP